jgi:hypothetical protein
MQSVQIIPGLHVDEEMFERATEALAAHTPDQKITWESFIDQNNWLLVPDPDGFGYKAEYKVLQSANRTIKINLWMSPDLRAGDAPMPHNHPWPFTAYVLMGGYKESRYKVVDGNVITTTEVHRAGDENDVPIDLFHEVTEIHEPGRTLTLMVCGEGIQGEWGYIDPETGEFRPNQPDPSFKMHLRERNPRLR